MVLYGPPWSHLVLMVLWFAIDPLKVPHGPLWCLIVPSWILKYPTVLWSPLGLHGQIFSTLVLYIYVPNRSINLLRTYVQMFCLFWWKPWLLVMGHVWSHLLSCFTLVDSFSPNTMDLPASLVGSSQTNKTRGHCQAQLQLQLQLQLSWKLRWLYFLFFHTTHPTTQPPNHPSTNPWKGSEPVSLSDFCKGQLPYQL